MGDLPDQRPRRHVRHDPGPEGDRGGGQRGQRLTEPGGLGARSSARTSRSTRASQPTPCVRSHSTWPGSRTARIQRRTVDSGRSSWAAIRRYPVPRALASNADPMTAVVSARRGATSGGQQHVGDPAGAAAGPPRSQGHRGGAVVAHGAGAGVTPGLQRAGASRAGQVAGGQVGLGPAGVGDADHRVAVGARRTSVVYQAPRPVGVSWCGTDPAGRRAGRVARVGSGSPR